MSMVSDKSAIQEHSLALVLAGGEQYDVIVIPIDGTYCCTFRSVYYLLLIRYALPTQISTANSAIASIASSEKSHSKTIEEESHPQIVDFTARLAGYRGRARCGVAWTICSSSTKMVTNGMAKGRLWPFWVSVAPRSRQRMASCRNTASRSVLLARSTVTLRLCCGHVYASDSHDGCRCLLRQHIDTMTTFGNLSACSYDVLERRRHRVYEHSGSPALR